MNGYGCLAAYYDRLMTDFDYEGYLSLLDRELEGHEGVDLCCGSGRITTALARRGKKVIGADMSAEMLGEAIKNARAAGVNPLFVQADATTFRPQHSVDFATCVCDGLNYIKPKNLAVFFENAACFLKKGAKFVFDVSSEYKLKKIIGSNVFFEDYDDLTYLWTNTPFAGGVKMELTFFIRGGDGKYTKQTEEHTQYAHKQSAIEEAMTGKFSYKAYDFSTMGVVGSKTTRILWVCERL